MISLLLALPFLANDVLAATYSLVSTETILAQNRITKSFNLPTNYSLYFDIKPTAISSEWGSILHATSTTNDCCAPGSRMPAIFFIPGSTALHIRIGSQTDGNWGLDTVDIPLNAWTTVEVRMLDLLVQVFYNSTFIASATAPSARPTGNATFYFSDPWYSPAIASIRSVNIAIGPLTSVVSSECQIVKNAWVAMGKPAVPATIHCCAMTGLACSKAYVTEIWWGSQGLRNSIPSALGNLTRLVVLDLSGNQLTGAIPSSLGSLTQLQQLNFGGNPLSGLIPASLGNLVQLTDLGICDTLVSGPIPASFGNLTKLWILWLQNNKLNGTIPDTLGNLNKLVYLSLAVNQLTGPIPASMGKMTGLDALWLQDNKLNGSIPASLGNLTKLGLLHLWTNQLSGPIPAALGNMTTLHHLDLSTNRLSGFVPSSIGNLKLQELVLFNNQLTGVPASLSNLVNCTRMWLLPNPMSLIPYDVIVKIPVSTMSVQNLTDFLATPKLVKRQVSSVATLTTDQLLAMCPLNYVANQDILAGCVAGIVYFCQGKTDLTLCQRYYDVVFAYSIFAPIGANCPAWKYGPRSLNCNNTVNSFSVSLEYTTVNKDFATFFAKTLFANTVYAPCNSTVQKCIW